MRSMDILSVHPPEQTIPVTILYHLDMKSPFVSEENLAMLTVLIKLR